MYEFGFQNIIFIYEIVNIPHSKKELHVSVYIKKCLETTSIEPPGQLHKLTH